jgi:ADP-heptose:LPS heptosyltransferase
VTLVGGPGEGALLEEVAGDSGARIRNPHRPLAELPPLLASCSVVVGNDSGVLHVSEAVGTPVVAIFGPTVRAWGYYPWREESVVFDHELPCRPCSKMGERECRLPETLCLTGTTVEDVRHAIEGRLHDPV